MKVKVETTSRPNLSNTINFGSAFSVHLRPRRAARLLTDGRCTYLPLLVSPSGIFPTVLGLAIDRCVEQHQLVKVSLNSPKSCLYYHRYGFRASCNRKRTSDRKPDEITLSLAEGGAWRKVRISRKRRASYTAPDGVLFDVIHTTFDLVGCRIVLLGESCLRRFNALLLSNASALFSLLRRQNPTSKLLKCIYALQKPHDVRLVPSRLLITVTT